MASGVFLLSTELQTETGIPVVSVRKTKEPAESLTPWAGDL